MALSTPTSQAPRQEAIWFQGSGGVKEHCTHFPALERAGQKPARCPTEQPNKKPNPTLPSSKVNL